MLQWVLNQLGKLTGLGSNVGNLVIAALAAKNDPSPENIRTAEHALKDLVEGEVSPAVAADIEAGQPIFDTTITYLETPSIANAEKIGVAVVNFGKHFRPEVPQELCDRIVSDVQELLSVEGIASAEAAPSAPAA